MYQKSLKIIQANLLENKKRERFLFLNQKIKKMENKQEIIRKTEGQFRKSNLPLMEVPQREQIKQRKKNF